VRVLRLSSAIAAAFTLTALFAACTATVNTTDLKVGDCFNYANTTDANGDPVNLPSPVDCTKPHSDEVFSVFPYPAPPDAGFPGYEAIGALRQTHCQADFASYVGVSWDKSSYTINYESPTEQGWAGGDRAIHCLLEDAAGANLNGSAKGSAR
jgi:Septum formation